MLQFLKNAFVFFLAAVYEVVGGHKTVALKNETPWNWTHLKSIIDSPVPNNPLNTFLMYQLLVCLDVRLMEADQVEPGRLIRSLFLADPP